MGKTNRKPKMKTKDSGILEQQRKAERQSRKRSMDDILVDHLNEIELDEQDALIESLSESYRDYTDTYNEVADW